MLFFVSIAIVQEKENGLWLSVHMIDCFSLVRTCDAQKASMPPGSRPLRVGDELRSILSLLTTNCGTVCEIAGHAGALPSTSTTR